MTLLILYVLLAIGFSFLCSILEAVLLSVSPSYVAAKEADDPLTAMRLKRLKDEVDRPLAAILSLNTIAHTVGATGAGAQAAYVFGDTAVGIFSGVLTLLILVFSEIIPKTLGATYWRGLAPLVARLLPLLIWSMWPLVKLSQGLTYLMTRGRDEATVSRDEIAALADVGHQEGVVEESETRIVRNLLALDVLKAEDVMTPRTVIFALPSDTSVKEVMGQTEELRFSRIPIFRDTIDHVSGFVLKDDVLLEAAKDRHDTSLSELKRELPVIAHDMPLKLLFERLLAEGDHIALVADPYGGTAGLVSLEDVVETLLGVEIVDEVDDTTDLQALARKRWEERARRLGIDVDAARTATGSSDGNDPPEAEEADVVRYGITGGVAPEQEKG